MSTETAERTTLGDRFLTQVERAGNKLPQPFNLFLILFLITGVVSTALAWADVAVTVPGSDEPIVIKGLFTGEGLAWFTANLDATPRRRTAPDRARGRDAGTPRRRPLGMTRRRAVAERD